MPADDARSLPTLDDLELSGGRVLVRSDLNVPLEDGRVADVTRVRAAAWTITEVLDQGGLPIVISHLGRPKGERDPALSLHAIVQPLEAALDGATVRFARDCIGDDAEEAVGAARPGERTVVLLENLRFHPGEKENDPGFADALARLGDAYVDDAFSAAHRAHASIVGVAGRLPSAAGRLMETELSQLSRLLAEPEHPFLVIFGGAKVETKLDVVAAMLGRADIVALCGAMANTVLAADGTDVGASLVQEDSLGDARRLAEEARQARCEFLLPEDVVVAPDMDSRHVRTVPVGEVPDGWMILDIGGRSTERILEAVRRSRTVVWNGPVGAAEHDEFARGTSRIADAIAERTTAGDLTSVIGGGDTVAALSRMDHAADFTHTSLAGGAFLKWLEGKRLPGVAALENSRRAA